MCIEVLKSKAQIQEARTKLERRALSFTSPWWKDLGRRIGLSKGIGLGDELKSWDVLRTVDFIENRVSSNAPILDIGAFASELPSILHNINYSNLVGIDLNPEIKKMPYSGAIRYEVSDFVNTHFARESFQVITAISVIEHGFKSALLLKEISRLLRPEGYFIASFDYWPDKVDTSGISFFGMDWTIFSEQEVRGFLKEAQSYNLNTSGQIDLTGGEKPIRCADKEYTFAWMVLQKSAGNEGSAK